MLHEAHAPAPMLGRRNTTFWQANAEALPFGHKTLDLVTCKVAPLVFPSCKSPSQKRSARPDARRAVLIDCMSSEHSAKRAHQNRLETLHRPAKTYVYEVGVRHSRA